MAKLFAILYIISASHGDITSQIVPADACEILARQINDSRGNNAYAHCVIAETKQD